MCCVTAVNGIKFPGLRFHPAYGQRLRTKQSKKPRPLSAAKSFYLLPPFFSQQGESSHREVSSQGLSLSEVRHPLLMGDNDRHYSATQAALSLFQAVWAGFLLPSEARLGIFKEILPCSRTTELPSQLSAQIPGVLWV